MKLRKTLGSRCFTLVLAIALVPVTALASVPVEVKARLGTPVVLVHQARQKAFLKVSLVGRRDASKRRAPINVALVIDKSGSMSADGKLEKAKEAALAALDRLGDDDLVSVVAYDQAVRVLVPATKASDRETIRAGIRRLSPGGNTALFAGVVKGGEELRKFLAEERVNRVILLSDGLANVGPATPGELAELGAALQQEGISVTTLGLGLGYNEDLMTRLARRSDGNHAFVENAGDLARIFAAELGELTSVAAQHVEIRIDCAPGVRPVRVLGREGHIEGRTVTIPLNQVYTGFEKFVLVEVELPLGEAGTERLVASVAVSFGDLDRKRTVKVEHQVAVRFSTSPTEVQKHTDRDVMIAAVELIANEKNELALELRDQGRVEDARKVLEDNASYLGKSASTWGSSKLEEQKVSNEDEAENLDADSWSATRKKMKYRQYQRETQQSF